MSGVTVRTKVLLLLCVMALSAACSSEDRGPSSTRSTASTTNTAGAPTSSTAPASAAEAVTLEGEGLGFVVDSAIRHARFGELGKAQLVAALSKVLGPPTREKDETCDSGADHSVTWGSLTTYFVADVFRGWYVDKPGFTTLNGIGPGSRRDEVEDAFADTEIIESTLGVEWIGGGVSGIFADDSPDAAVVAMWTGNQCIAR